MMNRALLELAAKAAEIVLVWPVLAGSTLPPRRADTFVIWNPLDDDGEALRLAAALGLEIGFGWTFHDKDDVTVIIVNGDVMEHINSANDRITATRHAIVRAAAEIGKAMT